MINKKFEAYKIGREIKRSGQAYEFKRNYPNEFGEPVPDEKVVGKVNGLYHEENSNIQIQTGDAVQYRTKKIPMILCLYEEVKGLELKPGDFVCIGKEKYKVTGFVDIQNWNIVADISLEVIDSGIRAQL